MLYEAPPSSFWQANVMHTIKSALILVPLADIEDGRSIRAHESIS